MAMDSAGRERSVTRRRFLGRVAAAGVGAAVSRWVPGTVPGASEAAAALRRGGTLKIAEIGEPLMLDPVATTADLTATLALPVFEELFAFDANWRIQPSLVSSYTVSKDGLTYTFTLRKDVPFHNGSQMTAADVVASLNRWGRSSIRGVAVYKAVDSVSAGGTDTVIMKMKSPFAPLLSFLALPNAPAAIMPKEIADSAGATPVRQLIGTGPYKFMEWAPDRYVHVARFDQYAARSEPPSGYAGRKDPLADDVYYYPVSQVATRIAGVQSGTYDIADVISQDAYLALSKDPKVDVGAVPGSYLVFVFNTRQGLMTSLKLRQALLVTLDMQPIMQAAFGNPNLYALDPSLYPKGTPWYTTAGADWYNVHNVDRAKQLAKEAGYSGQPIRWLSTLQYDYMFKGTVVASNQLEHAGFKVDLQVMDWASLLDHRAKPPDWEVYVTSGSFVPDPALQSIYDGTTHPGWWDTPDKNRVLAAFTAETDQAKRAQLWAKLQQLWYAEAPVVRPGGFDSLVLSRKGLPGFKPAGWIMPWNVEAVK